MPITISEEEKRAIQDYFDHPERYIGKVPEVLCPGGVLPNGTKVSRAKYSREKDVTRCYIIPVDGENEPHRIPITELFSNDPATHSATLRWCGTICFHQNKDDLPKILPANFDVSCGLDDNEEGLAPEEIADYRAIWTTHAKIPNYILYRGGGIFSGSETTIKYAVDSDGHLFYLKRYSWSGDAAASPANAVEVHAPQLYMGPSISRCSFESAEPSEMLIKMVGMFGKKPSFCSSEPIKLTKRIDITRDAGDNLIKFIRDRQGQLSAAQIETLAKEILHQYLIHIDAKNLVHTDIKALNICVKETSNIDHPFEIRFIDFEEAFHADRPSETGWGTREYMPPEFFKTVEGFRKQFEPEITERASFQETRLPDYKKRFSKASDIFALGCVLIRDLALQPNSDLYTLACSMCAVAPENRPSGERIRVELSRLEVVSSEQRGMRLG
ncbi:MAG: hypothetical protein NXI01_06090 [Gammaproteobacteria bacterium]|nr:hypothetical protein [Gammaproteobacteria bacterium]